MLESGVEQCHLLPGFELRTSVCRAIDADLVLETPVGIFFRRISPDDAEPDEELALSNAEHRQDVKDAFEHSNLLELESDVHVRADEVDQLELVGNLEGLALAGLLEMVGAVRLMFVLQDSVELKGLVAARAQST